jgi:hypothetical protein
MLYGCHHTQHHNGSGADMGYIRDMNRDQVVRFPDIIDEYIEASNPVRFIDAYIERLDLKARGFTQAVPRG